jgi:hypothetical protein
MEVIKTNLTPDIQKTGLPQSIIVSFLDDFQWDCFYIPVNVMCIVILKDSDSMVWTPELLGTGAMRDVMACTPCNVPAITRYSFDDSCAMPAVVGYGRTMQRYRGIDARQYLTFSEVGRGKGLPP